MAPEKVLLNEGETITKYLGDDSRIDLSNIAKETNTNSVNAMIAGYVAGCSGTVVGYPLDSLKVWMQTNTFGKNAHLRKRLKKPKLLHYATTQLKSSSAEKSNDIRRSSKHPAAWRNSFSTKAIPCITTEMKHKASDATMMILTKGYKTIRASYSGLTIPLVTVGMVQSVNFATYDGSRQFLYRQQHPSCSNPREYLTHDSLQNIAMSGSIGGATTAFITAPFIMVKINQQITGNTFGRAFRKIFMKEAVPRDSVWNFRPFRSYGSAFVPHVLFESVGRAIYVSTYEWMKRSMVSSKCESSASLSIGDRVLCAGASGITSWGILFPCDALRNRMYHSAGSRERNMTAKKSIVETICVMRNERAFYRGFSVCILRAAPVAAAVLPVYDITLERLSSRK